MYKWKSASLLTLKTAISNALMNVPLLSLVATETEELEIHGKAESVI